MKTFSSALLMTILAVPGVWAQTAPKTPETRATMGGRQQMMASMQANDAKLDDLVAQLNAARGNDRLDKLVAVVNALVAERKTMRSMMAGMMGSMMTAPETSAAPKTEDDHSAHHPPAPPK